MKRERRTSTDAGPLILAAALDAIDLEMPVVAIEPGGSKRPAVKHYGEGDVKRLASDVPSRCVVERIFGSGRYGLGVICGALSGVEMFEFEGRAVKAGIYVKFVEEVRRAGLQDVWARLERGFSFQSPSGGRNLLARPTTVAPSRRLASRPTTQMGVKKVEVLIEIRGEGDYGIVPPTDARFHILPKGWVQLSGDFESIADVSDEDWLELQRIARSFDELPAHALKTARGGSLSDVDGRPGTAFNDDPEAQKYVLEMLKDADWVPIYGGIGDTIGLLRPGKDLPGLSAHLFDSGCVYVFTTSSDLEGNASYSPFAIKAMLRHAGDFSEAASELAEMGYGDRLIADDSAVASDGTTPRMSQANRLIELAGAHFRFGRSEDDRAFAEPLDGPRIAWPLKGKTGVTHQLDRLFFEKYAQRPTQNARSECIQWMEGEAFAAHAEPVWVRVATHGDGVALDLGDESGAGLAIGPDGWETVERGPVLFRRTNQIAPLPRPVMAGAGDLEHLRELLNVSDRQWRLIVGWLIAAFMPGVPSPILDFEGPQGSGKSKAARIVRDFIDPSPVALTGPATTPRDWAARCAGSLVVGYDNVTRISETTSDMLCRVVFGDAFAPREMYSDEETHIIKFRRVVMITSIDLGTIRSDLAERMLRIELKPMTAGDRRTEAELDRELERRCNVIFTGLLDLLVKVLAALPEVQRAELPRMADVAKVYAALDHVTGWSTFEDYWDNVDASIARVGEGNAVATAIVDLLVKMGGAWSGSAGELAAALDVTPFFRPKTPKAMGNELSRLQSVLPLMGVEVVKGRRNSGIHYDLRRTDS